MKLFYKYLYYKYLVFKKFYRNSIEIAKYYQPEPTLVKNFYIFSKKLKQNEAFVWSIEKRNTGNNKRLPAAGKALTVNR